jgi:DNA-binding CsgD family transcriptional regulator
LFAPPQGSGMESGMESLVVSELMCDEELLKSVAELHDETEHLLLSLILQLESLRGYDDGEVVKGRLVGLQHTATQGLRQLQRLNGQLNPYLLSRVGLAAALRALIREYGGLTFNLDVADDLPEPPFAIARLLLRVTRAMFEQWHSALGAAALRLAVKGEYVFLQISSREALLRMGEEALLSFQSELDAAGGRYWLNPEDTQGATLNLLLPWHNRRESENSRNETTLNGSANHLGSGALPVANPAKLSEREKQVLIGLLHGYNLRQIGEKLFLSKSTVETYKRRIYEKLGFETKAELIAYAIEQHLYQM